MPVIEEVLDDDVDNTHLSLEEFDPHNPFSKSMPVEGGARLRPTGATRAQPSTPAAAAVNAAAAQPAQPAQRTVNTQAGLRTVNIAHKSEMPEHMKTWTQLYPVYFDSKKTRRQGRRVDAIYAVKNPLAVTISDACVSLGLSPALELTKTHPKDWSNPGRVRVNLPEGTSKAALLVKLAKFLKEHPPTEKTARKEVYERVALFDSLQPIASLRNERMPPILPGVSPVLNAKKTIEAETKKGLPTPAS